MKHGNQFIIKQPNHRTVIEAMTRLFQADTSVTCDHCERELKVKFLNIPRLLRAGCPSCGCTGFTYHGLDEATYTQLSTIPGAKPA